MAFASLLQMSPGLAMALALSHDECNVLGDHMCRHTRERDTPLHRCVSVLGGAAGPRAVLWRPLVPVERPPPPPANGLDEECLLLALACVSLNSQSFGLTEAEAVTLLDEDMQAAERVFLADERARVDPRPHDTASRAVRRVHEATARRDEWTDALAQLMSAGSAGVCSSQPLAQAIWEAYEALRGAETLAGTTAAALTTARAAVCGACLVVGTTAMRVASLATLRAMWLATGYCALVGGSRDWTDATHAAFVVTACFDPVGVLCLLSAPIRDGLVTSPGCVTGEWVFAGSRGAVTEALAVLQAVILAPASGCIVADPTDGRGRPQPGELKSLREAALGAFSDRQCSLAPVAIAALRTAYQGYVTRGAGSYSQWCDEREVVVGVAPFATTPSDTSRWHLTRDLARRFRLFARHRPAFEVASVVTRRTPSRRVRDRLRAGVKRIRI